ncbi:hypothetical protein GJ744_009587 [Endocarpon pusillum]|uniref:Uncharacterized protein n=1 Tax=Endocarpon pusillum TaxID=364733 RepID=A0A8H7AJG4_9EURO|nr:hypothetical protein GJ744_009587 [Endocarpon pusillum]
MSVNLKLCGLTPVPSSSPNKTAAVAFNPTHGTVASRIQAFQNGQASRSPHSAGKIRSSIQRAEVDIPIGRVRRANTTSAAPACPPTIEGKECSQQGEIQEVDAARHEPITNFDAGENILHASLPARPATSYESTTPLRQHKLHSFSRQVPERSRTQKRQSSLDAQPTTQIQLSEARARLRCIDDRRTRTPIVPLTDVNMSSVRQDADIHQLQDLIDNALDEQAKLDVEGTSAKQSPRLKSIPSQVEISMNSPSKRQWTKTESSDSPVRCGRDGRDFSRPRMSVTTPKGFGRRDGDNPSSASTSPSPMRKQRLSTETVLPRSSTESEPLATASLPSVYSFREMKSEQETSSLNPTISTRQVPSPVKQRTAAFEKMVQRDKPIMYDQPHRHIAGAPLKKHWWLDPDENRVHRVPGLLKQEARATRSKAKGVIQHDPPASPRTTTPMPRPGPIPLALPQLISSRGRAVSATSQFEDTFETAPQSEAALSRLSSRVHSPRTIPKALAAQDIRQVTKSPFLRWNPFMLDKKLPANKTVPLSPGESGVGVNVGCDVAEQTIDTASHLQPQGNDLAAVAIQDAISKCEHGQNTATAVMQQGDMPPSATHREIYESHPSKDLSPQPLTPRKIISPKQDRNFRDAAVPGEIMERAHGAGGRHEVIQTKPRYSSGDMTIDDEKELLIAPNIANMDEHGDVATETGDETSWQRQSKDLTPFSLVQVEDNRSAPTSASGSPIRGRVASRTLHQQSRVMRNKESRNGVSVSRSRSKVGNVRVTVEVRTPQGSPSKGNARRDSVGDGGGKGERVVIVTTDVQDSEEGSVEGLNMKC